MSATQTTVRSAVLDLLRGIRHDVDLRQPRFDRTAAVPALSRRFPYVLGLQESVVVGMADGYAQAVRNAAFVNLHSAAGVGHAMGSIFTAYKNRTPLVITAGQQGARDPSVRSFLHSAQATELPKPTSSGAVSRRAPKTCRTRSRAATILRCSRRADGADLDSRRRLGASVRQRASDVFSTELRAERRVPTRSAMRSIVRAPRSRRFASY
jgi:hypothetical protein